MRSFFTKLAVVASSILFAGCAVPTDPADTESTDGSEAEITKATARYLGTWSFDATATGTVKFYSQLTLETGSEYSALKSPTCAKGKACPLYLVVESGKWSVTAKGTLTLRPTGGDKRVFTSSVSDDGFGLKLVDSTGHEYFTRLARAGEHCGGFIATAKNCEEGLVCFLGTHPDAGGTCTKPAAEGESCGFRTQSKPCVDGLECRHVSGPLDALTCAKPATSEGKFCGGIAGIACPTDYTCVLDGAYPDAGGKCHAIEGSFCGGIAGIACPAGFGCVLSGSYPDAGGVCHACPPPAVRCAAPPAGCHYETPAGTCQVGCGTLVCSGS